MSRYVIRDKSIKYHSSEVKIELVKYLCYVISVLAQIHLSTTLFGRFQIRNDLTKPKGPEQHSTCSESTELVCAVCLP